MTNRSDYPNSGILFINDRKSEEHDPDHKGNADITCPHCGNRSDYWLNAWRKLGRRSGEFLSLSFKAKEEAAERPGPTPRPQQADMPWQRSR